MNAEDFAKAFQPLMKVAIDAYLSVNVLNQHYIETVSQLTGKDKEVIKQELEKLLPEQRIKTEAMVKDLMNKVKASNTDNKN